MPKNGASRPRVDVSHFVSQDAKPDRALRRLLRKPAVAAHLQGELDRLGGNHAVLDVRGTVLAGNTGNLDSGAQDSQSCEIRVDGRLLGSVRGPAARELARWLEVMLALDDECRAVGEEALSRYRELTVLYALSEKIVGENDPKLIAELVCGEAAQFLGCDSAAVLLLNPETQLLEITATCGAPFHDRSAREIEDDIIATVIRSGQAQIVNDVPGAPRSLAARNALRSLIIAPLKSHERVFGVLVAGTEHTREFSAGELQILSSIASHAAASIEATRLSREIRSTEGKPAAVLFGVGERPPWATTGVVAMQHVLISLISLAYPVLIAMEAAAPPGVAASVVSMALLAMAAATALQSMRAGPIGSGFLAPYITSAIFLGPCLMAAQAGGLSLVAGMTAFAGLCMVVLSVLMRRFRKLFPPEVSGVVVLMIGVTMVPVALPRALGADEGVVVSGSGWLVGLLTLGLIVLLTVLPLRRLRLYATALALGAGYAAAYAFDLFDPGWPNTLRSLPLLDVAPSPVLGLGIRFSTELAVPFLAAALASSIKEAGLLISVQKMSDAQWKRPDMSAVGRGIVASGIGNIVAGGLGGVGVGIGAGNVGLAAATGAMSRSIGFAVAGLFAVLAFTPRFTAILAAIPAPVMGAGLLFVACHLVVSGAELITARMLDAKRNYVVGIPLLAGIGLMIMPGIFEGAPAWLQPALSSALGLSTILALVLNLVLNAGVSNRAVLHLSIDGDIHAAVSRFFERQGASWGARQDVIRRASPATTEGCEEIRHVIGVGTVEVRVEFDEFHLVVTIIGGNNVFGSAATAEVRDAKQALARVAEVLARRYGCRARVSEDGALRMVFEH